MNDISLHITIAATGASFIISMIMMLLWARGEARADYRHLEAGLQANQNAFEQYSREIRNEMKDFHGRLCKIEEERNKILLRGLK